MLEKLKAVLSERDFFIFSIILIPVAILIISIIRKYLYVVFSTPTYLTLHNVLEFFSIVVSFSVFMTAWHGIKQSHNKQDSIICFTFLAFVIFDIAHTLSYNGMPDFLTPNNVNKASTFWILAVLSNAIGLFLASQFSPKDNKHWSRLPLVLIMVFLSSALLIIMVAYYPQIFPAMFIEGQGQTSSKIILEYIVILLSFGALVSFNRYREKENDSIIFLQGALLFNIFGELSFTLYSHAYDIFNLLGHTFRILGDYFILQALFVSSLKKPYLQLWKAKEKIQTLADKNSSLYQQAREQRHELEECFSLIGKAISSRLDLKETLKVIANLAANMLKAKYSLVALAEEKKNQFTVLAAKGLSQSFGKIPMENSLAGRAYKEKVSCWVKDIRNSPSIFLPEPIADKISCVVATPITSKNNIVGILELYFEDEYILSARESRLLSAFARHAGAALESSLLFQETTRCLKEQQTLYNLVTNLSSPLSLEEILKDCIIDTVQALEGSKGSIFLIDEDDEMFLEEAATTENTLIGEVIGNKYPGIRLEEEQWLAWTLKKDQPNFFCNINREEDKKDLKEWWLFCPTVLVVPLSIKEKLVGALFLGWKERNEKISGPCLALATAIGQQLAMGIERNKLYKEIEKAAFTDPLTSLANRRQFSLYLENSLLRANRLQSPLCLVLLDLDKFKHYNDTYGHPTGDKVLTQIGQILLNSISANNLSARYGGEEFAIILSDCDLQKGLTIAETIRKSIEEDYFPDNHGSMIVKITASLGLACYYPDSTRALPDMDELIEQADAALYQAKNTGRNKVCFYS